MDIHVYILNHFVCRICYMAEKEELGRNKANPGGRYSTTFSIMLCIYFCYLFRIALGAITQLRKDIIPELLTSETPVLSAIYYLISFLWIAYSIWAVILVLKGTRTAIKCLYLCLPYNIVSFFIASAPKVSLYYSVTWWLPVAILLYPVIFWIYIANSKEVKERFPKEERKYGLQGIAGISLYVALGIIFIIMMSTGIITDSRGNKVSMEKIELFNNELTDGRVIFIPEPSWRHDSTSVLNTVMDAFYFRDTLNNSQVCVVCAKEEYEPSRHYYIYSIYENQPIDMIYYDSEGDYYQHEDENDIIYVDQYRYVKDSTVIFWTYASRIGKNNTKSLRISITEQDTLRTSVDDVVRLLNGATLDLRSRLLKKDRIYKKDDSGDSEQIYQPT